MNSSYDDYNPASVYVAYGIAKRCVLGNVIDGKLRKIDAIKAYRLATGEGLRVSKHAIDAAWEVVQQEIRDRRLALFDELARNAQTVADVAMRNTYLLNSDLSDSLSNLSHTLTAIHNTEAQ